MPESKEKEENPPRCRQCHCTIQLGEDIVLLQRSVMGPRGPVPLEDPITLCSDVCLRGYVNGTDEKIEQLPRRVP